MQVELISADELQQFKAELLAELKDAISSIKTSSPNDYLTAEQVKEILGISSKQFQIMRNRHQIIHYVVGRKIYVKRSDLDAFLEEYKINSNN